MFVWFLVLGFVASVQASLSLLYPSGGEKLHNNGRHTIVWTNQSDTRVGIYIDWYDSDGNLLVDNNNIYSQVLSGGTNMFVLSKPEGYPIGYKYKIRLVGTNSSGTTSVSSDFVYITGPAKLIGWANDRSPWLSGQDRKITITWSGFETSQNVKVFLESSVMERSGYGYNITNFVLGQKDGMYSFILSHQDLPNIDGDVHTFVMVNEESQIVGSFKNIDVATFIPKLSVTRDLEEQVILFEVICKPQTLYVLQSSVDLISWNDEFSTNTVENFFRFSTPTQGENKFFRIRED